MRKWPEKNKKAVEKHEAGRLGQQAGGDNYAAIDLGTNSCRLVIATPTPSSFRIVETFSKITRLGEGIINNNELSHTAIRRTINALRVCAGVLEEYQPIVKARYVATAACRRAKNCRYFMDLVKKETGLNIEIISPQEESRLAVVGCVPLLNRNIKRALVFDIGGGSTEVSLARMSNSGRTIIEGFVSLPYGVVTVSEAFPEHDMTDLAYNTIIDRTHKILAEFEEKYHISEEIKNQKIQVLGTSGTVTVLGAIHLNLSRYNRSAVDGLALSAQDVDKTISKIKRMGDEGRKKHACIGMQKADLTIAGCAIIEGLMSFWNISEITIADRGIREGILLDLMHSDRKDKKYSKKFRRRYPFNKKTRKYFNNNYKPKEVAND